MSLQAELSYLQAHLATLELPSPPPPPNFAAQPPVSISDLPSASSLPVTYDLSSLFDPMAQPAWAMQQQRLDHRQFSSGGAGGSSTTAGEGDLQALARSLLHRHGGPPCSNASSPPSLSKWNLLFFLFKKLILASLIPLLSKNLVENWWVLEFVFFFFFLFQIYLIREFNLYLV